MKNIKYDNIDLDIEDMYEKITKEFELLHAKHDEHIQHIKKFANT